MGPGRIHKLACVHKAIRQQEIEQYWWADGDGQDEGQPAKRRRVGPEVAPEQINYETMMGDDLDHEIVVGDDDQQQEVPNERPVVNIDDDDSDE